MPLLNVRLDAEDDRLAKELREVGVPISRVVRDAIRAEHARRISPRTRRIKPSELVEALFEEIPDPAGTTGHGIDTTDRHAVRRAIATRLGRTRR